MIQPIVEGHGEVEAAPVLLRRLVNEAKVFDLKVGKPIRKNRSELVNRESLLKAVKVALLKPGCRAILILFDSDDDCPKDLAGTVEGWAKQEARNVPCAVVMAHREYEAWFLASIESLRGKHRIRLDAEPHPRPEGPRDAKGEFEQRMVARTTYSETADQAPLSATFDMRNAYVRCRSFRRMVKAFGELASGMGIGLPEWPPSSWKEGTTT